MILQSCNSSIIDLPARWLWVALIPLLSILLVGGYIGKLKGAGFEFEPGKASLQYVSQDAREPREDSESLSIGMRRDAEYKKTKGYFFVHSDNPSRIPGLLHNISIYLIRHVVGNTANQRENFDEIESIKFYFGKNWGDRVFTIPNNGGLLGIRTSAWGTFLASCEIKFKDPKIDNLVLYRYIDFEMADVKT